MPFFHYTVADHDHHQPSEDGRLVINTDPAVEQSPVNTVQHAEYGVTQHVPCGTSSNGVVKPIESGSDSYDFLTSDDESFSDVSSDSTEPPSAIYPQSTVSGEYTPPLDSFSVNEHSFNNSMALHSTPRQSPDAQNAVVCDVNEHTHHTYWEKVESLETPVPVLSQSDVNSNISPPLTNIARLVDTIGSDQLEWTQTVHAPRATDDVHHQGPTADARPVQQPKLPYSYAALCVMAIENADENRLTLTGIRDALLELFPVLKFTCKSWKNNFQQTVFKQDCFYREYVTEKRAGKDKQITYWRVDMTLVKPWTFKRQRRGVYIQYKPTLHEQLGVPEIVIPPENENHEVRKLMSAINRFGRNAELLRQALSKTQPLGASSDTTVLGSATQQQSATNVPKTHRTGRKSDLRLPYLLQGDTSQHSVVCDTDDFLTVRTECHDGDNNSQLRHSIASLLSPDDTHSSGSQSPPVHPVPSTSSYTGTRDSLEDRHTANVQGRKRNASDTDLNQVYKRQKFGEESGTPAPTYEHSGYRLTNDSRAAMTYPRDVALPDYLSRCAGWNQAAAWTTAAYHFGLTPNPAAYMYPGVSVYPEMYPGYSVRPYTSVPANMHNNSPAFDQHRQSPEETYKPYAYQWYKHPETTPDQGAIDLSIKD